MASNNGPSGRSPFPGRNSRRRLSAASEMDESTASSSANFTGNSPPLIMGNLLSQSRLSPAAASGWSPMNSSRSTTTQANRRRFFEDATRTNKSTDGGVLATAIPCASMGAANKTATNEQQQEEETMMNGMNLSQIRTMARNAFQTTSSPQIAVFYASILYSKTQTPEDAYLYAQTLAASGQELRSVRILHQAGLFTTGEQTCSHLKLEAILLAAVCLSKMGEWQESLTLLESATQTSPSSVLEDDDDAGWQALVDSIESQEFQLHPVARLALERGRAYNETANPTRAALYWKRALRVDAHCVEAYDLLLGSNMLVPQDAHELVSSLSFGPEMDWLRHYYYARISLPSSNGEKHHEEAINSPATPSFAVNGQGVDASSIQMATPSYTMFEGKDENNQKLPPKNSIHACVSTSFRKTVNTLDKAPEALALGAIRSYRQYDLTSALEYCKRLQQVDPLCPTASFVHVATLVALDCKRVLFQLAHEWVQAFPKSAHAWFAVGSYYYACGRFHVAQRHYCRATRLDPSCAEAWIAFGCSFAMSDETDQALASFRAAQRLAPALYVPLLYMGMEYLRTNHLVLARHFLMAANKTSGGDPLSLHELGVADYQRKEYASAAVWFQKSLEASSSNGHPNNDDAVELCQDVFWEPTLFNLGQCHRKSRNFAQAARCFEKCLSLCPGSASCYSALAFTKHLSGDIDTAIELYHQALSRKPDDPLSTEMLNRALTESLAIGMTDQDLQMTDSFSTTTTTTPGDGRMFTPSFGTPRDSGAWRSSSSRRTTRSATRRGLDLSLDTSRDDDNPDLSMDSDDVDMSMS